MTGNRDPKLQPSLETMAAHCVLGFQNPVVNLGGDGALSLHLPDSYKSFSALDILCGIGALKRLFSLARSSRTIPNPRVFWILRFEIAASKNQGRKGQRDRQEFP